MTKQYSYAAAAAQRVLISGRSLKALMQQYTQINYWEAYILIAEVLVRNMKICRHWSNKIELGPYGEWTKSAEEWCISAFDWDFPELSAELQN